MNQETNNTIEQKTEDVKPENTSVKQEIDVSDIPRDKNGRVLPGRSLNPHGRPKMSRNFYTDFREAIKNIKDKNTGESLDEIKIIKIGVEKMLKGDAKFEGLYRDLLDRVYGKPVQDITTGGEKLNSVPQIVGVRIIKE